MNLRILKSSTSKSLNSCLEAYQRLRQSSMIPTRNPVGCTFWPMAQRSFGIRLWKRSGPTRPPDRERSSVVIVIGSAGTIVALATAPQRLQVGQADLDVGAAA